MPATFRMELSHKRANGDSRTHGWLQRNYQSKKIGCEAEILFSTFTFALMISVSTYDTFCELHLSIDNIDMLFEKNWTTKSILWSWATTSVLSLLTLVKLSYFWPTTTWEHRSWPMIYVFVEPRNLSTVSWEVGMVIACSNLSLTLSTYHTNQLNGHYMPFLKSHQCQKNDEQ